MRLLSFFALLLALKVSSTLQSDKKYQIVTAYPKTIAESDNLHEFLIGSTEFESLSCHHERNCNPVQLLSPSQEASSRLKGDLQAMGIKAEVTVEDFGQLVNEHRIMDRSIKVDSGTEKFDCYPRYEEVMDYLDDLAQNNADIVVKFEKGETFEGRRLVLLKIGDTAFGSETRAVWIDSGIHAREWIAVSVGLNMIDRLVNEFRKVAETGQRNDITNVDWYIMPLLNPDGYEFSHANASNRLWRKNRSINKNSHCRGVDLNRNWKVEGFGVGASDNPCSNTYKGTGPNTEPEVIAASKTLDSLKDIVRVSLSLHSAGSWWLTSWGYTKDFPVDDEKMEILGHKAAAAIKSVNGREYKVGAAGPIFYPAGGASDDWAKKVAKIPYAVTVEFPAKDLSGRDFDFRLPESEIENVSQEFWPALIEVAKAAKAEELGPDPNWKLEMEAVKKREEEKRRMGNGDKQG